jgi:heme-degrading monooxygenase HmoA
VFISVTRVKLPKERLERMAEAFRQGAPDLKRFPGFLGFELWTNEDTLEAVSRWESREAMEAYAHSEVFRAHHGGGAGGAHPHGAHGAHGESAPAVASGSPHGGSASPGQGPGEVVYFDAEVLA